MSLSALFDIRDGAPQPADLTLAVVGTVVYCVLRYIGELALRPLGWALGTKDAIDNLKFTEQSIKFLHHTIATVYGLWYITRQPWYDDVDLVWAEFASQTLDTEFKLYYLIQIGFHSMSLIFHFVEQRRTDYYAMLIHHVATVILVFVSYSLNYTRIGALVFLVHDFSDVFGCALKLSVLVDDCCCCIVSLTQPTHRMSPYCVYLDTYTSFRLGRFCFSL